MNGEKKRRCRKCLPSYISEEEFYTSLRSYVQNISPDVRASEEEYEQRLELCRRCSYHINGICGKCGCFVEMRAVVRNRACPDIPPKWEKIECREEWL